ncbi:hypothetical protein BCR34DRAFT_391643 [Clohesyomyces aquaticus]|uniref:Uncharacterized protein n=1 Tax=Clohesyomyces aquaticus TaxID=1231657 RepID=A0A1Y1ZFD5_9PLEO|nr:hypothetical protein BCR34DRAFT_391643 [Clohesyomyces aquaticus]
MSSGSPSRARGRRDERADERYMGATTQYTCWLRCGAVVIDRMRWWWWWSTEAWEAPRTSRGGMDWGEIYACSGSSSSFRHPSMVRAPRRSLTEWEVGYIHALDTGDFLFPLWCPRSPGPSSRWLPIHRLISLAPSIIGEATVSQSSAPLQRQPPECHIASGTSVAQDVSTRRQLTTMPPEKTNASQWRPLHRRL